MVFNANHGDSNFIDVDNTNVSVVVDADVDIKFASCYFGIISNSIFLSFLKPFG